MRWPVYVVWIVHLLRANVRFWSRLAFSAAQCGLWNVQVHAMLAWANNCFAKLILKITNLKSESIEWTNLFSFRIRFRMVFIAGVACVWLFCWTVHFHSFNFIAMKNCPSNCWSCFDWSQNDSIYLSNSIEWKHESITTN